MIDNALVKVVDAYTVDPSYCPVTYALEMQNGDPINNLLINFDEALRTLTVHYTDINDFASYVADYDLKIVGTSGDKTVDLNFVLQVLDPCAAPTITASSLADQTYELISAA